MKWLKKLLGMETATPTTTPVDAGAKAFDTMAKTLSAPEEKVATVTVAAQAAPEVQTIAVKVEEAVKEAKPKAPRKPRAKKVADTNPAGWPFPGEQPAEGEKKPKPAARKVKAK